LNDDDVSVHCLTFELRVYLETPSLLPRLMWVFRRTCAYLVSVLS